jgi:mandelate racemase
MTAPGLTVRDLVARPVRVPLGRPLATRVGTFAQWPLVLVDLHTEEGVTGRGYLTPYVDQGVAAILPAERARSNVVIGATCRPRTRGARARTAGRIAATPWSTYGVR